MSASRLVPVHFRSMSKRPKIRLYFFNTIRTERTTFQNNYILLAFLVYTFVRCVRRFPSSWFRLPFGLFGAVRSFCGPLVPLSLFRSSVRPGAFCGPSWVPGVRPSLCHLLPGLVVSWRGPLIVSGCLVPSGKLSSAAGYPLPGLIVGSAAGSRAGSAALSPGCVKSAGSVATVRGRVSVRLRSVRPVLGCLVA